MSHFSTIKTKIKDRKALLQALMLMGHPVMVDEKLENPSNHEHEEISVNIAIGKDIGFRWNEVTQSYELVTDLQTWDQPVPVVILILVPLKMIFHVFSLQCPIGK